MIQETEGRTAKSARMFAGKGFEADRFAAPEDILIEPTLDEILADPIVHLVLGRDHLEIGDVERFLRSATKRLEARRHKTNTVNLSA